MIARPLFKYAGSKWNLAAHYPRPRFDRIVEPFAGSACYATRHHEREVLLVEIDDEVAALWRYLIATPGDAIARLPADVLEPGVDLRTLDVPDGGKLLIRAWQRVGMGRCWTVSVWNGRPGMWSDRTRDHVAESVGKIRHWRVLHADYRLALDDRPATWFVDPPYQGLPLYGARTFDHARLAEDVRGMRGQVVVCEQMTATWLPFRPFREIANGRRAATNRKMGRSFEAIWTSDTENP